jgi:hypothetical protein
MSPSPQKRGVERLELSGTWMTLLVKTITGQYLTNEKK